MKQFRLKLKVQAVLFSNPSLSIVHNFQNFLLDPRIDTIVRKLSVLLACDDDGNFSADKGRLIRYKFRWAEADEDPQDNQLNLEEFKSFRHPEQSPKMLKRMVQDILDSLGELCE